MIQFERIHLACWPRRVSCRSGPWPASLVRRGIRVSHLAQPAESLSSAEENLRGSRPAALGVRLESHGAQAKQAMGRIDTIRDAANRLGEFFQTESSIALTEPDAVVKGFLTQGQKRGTIAGEIFRGAALFKAF